MKFFSIVMVCFCVIGSLNGVTAIKAEAGDYLGDYCWNVSNTTLEWSGKLQLGVTHIGSGHCLCSGIITVTDPFYLQVPTHGNMELIGNEIRISLSFPGIRNGHLGIDMHSIRLDPNTLNGTAECIGVYFDTVELSEGTLTYTTCQ